MKTDKDVINYLNEMENVRCESFLQAQEPSIGMYDDKNKSAIRFVAAKCFRIGYKIGIVTAMDALEKYQKGTERNGE